jgi:NAD(P)-dependent dehydrogenase (short-subunit alcohol dehydrogenase family)
VKPVAVFVPVESQVLGTEDFEDETWEKAAAAFRSSVDFDYCDSPMIAAGFLAGRTDLVLLAACRIPEATLQQMFDFVDEGGRLWLRRDERFGLLHAPFSVDEIRTHWGYPLRDSTQPGPAGVYCFRSWELPAAEKSPNPNVPDAETSADESPNDLPPSGDKGPEPEPPRESEREEVEPMNRQPKEPPARKRAASPPKPKAGPDRKPRADLPLLGKVALVTGGSQGLGRGIALVLAEQGAAVAINYRSAKKKAAEVVAEIESMGRKARAVQGDVSRETEVQQMFEATRDHFGRVDILVNNAGTSAAQDIFETDENDWRRIIDTNLTSCFLCCKEAMQCMREQGSGRIVLIGSVVGQQGAMFGHVHYAASKSGMIGLMKTLARTAAPLGINVNAVAPGCIGTELLHAHLSQERIEELTDSIPLGLGTPRDVGLAVAFLCGEGGRYITGATLDVNGGLYLR